MANLCIKINFFLLPIEEGKNKHQVDFGCDDDTLCLQAGKEFALMLTSQGRVHYTGKTYFDQFNMLCVRISCQD